MRFFIACLVVLLINNSPCYAQEIQIESDFDSGNLRMAAEIGPGEYNIELEPYNDAAVWFHFRVVGAKGSTLTFHLLNGQSGESIWYNLDPAVSPDWKNWDNIFDHSYNGSKFTFTHTFNSDTTYICTHPAFNNEMMEEYLDSIEPNPKVVNRTTIANSVQGRPVEMVQLTDPTVPDVDKLGVWMIARQHASELAGWYVLQGLMNWLLSEDPHAEEVMKHMIFNIVPLMNPDGVYLGKYRTTSTNLDLNRQWDNANPNTEPSVYAVTQLIQTWVNQGKDFSYFTDFHATKGGRACFIYHASSSLVPNFISQEYYDNQTEFLSLIAQNCPLTNVYYSPSISSSTSTSISRQYMINKYKQQNPKFLALLYEGINVPVNYGPYNGQAMTIELEHENGVGFGEAIYQHYVEPNLEIVGLSSLSEQSNNVSLYPNPFSTSTKFKVELKYSQNIKIEIYSAIGQHVQTLANQKMNQGTHHFEWVPKGINAGLYVFKIQTNNSMESGTIIYTQ